MEQLKSRIEAVLFVTAKVLQINEIAEILEEQPEAVHQHRHEQHAVQPVQHAAVAGKQIGIILQFAVALDQGGKQVSHLPREAAQQADDQVHPPRGQIVPRRVVTQPQ